jgi:hypothetical protein
MADPANGKRRFEVHASAAVHATIRRLHRRASRRGHGHTVTKAFRQILRRLETDPWRAGEPAYQLPAMRLQVRTILIRPLVVDFAVCEDRPFVFIKGVKMLSAR